jgi:polyisoprenoid-binding protein YceI
MIRIDSKSAECLVFTFKEGVLSAMAHDLKIRVSDFEISFEESTGTIDARFNARSLEVVCARADGRDAPNALSDKDKHNIKKNIAEEVLEVRKHPEIRFRSTRLDPTQIAGTLMLHGVERPIEIPMVREGDILRAEACIHQPDFGMRPYKAMLGTLRVQADVRVQVSLSAKRVGW